MDAATGKVQGRAVAMGGTNAATEMELLLDGGESRADASSFGPNLGPHIRRPFAVPSSPI